MKVEQTKEIPPLTPSRENGGETTSFSSSHAIPGYAYDKKTHNLEGLMLELNALHVVEPEEVRSILKLSDYGRIGGYIWKVIRRTHWSTVLTRGKYIIAALVKEKKGIKN